MAEQGSELVDVLDEDTRRGLESSTGGSGKRPSPSARGSGRRRVGDYRIVALLGEGGMAQVHLAIKHGPAGFKKLVVVKSMREELVDAVYLKSFMHEARLAAQLSHPNVVQTYEVGEADGKLFIAMEYVEGQSMRAVQRRLAPKRLPLAVQLRIIAEVARGLHHAHTLKSFDGQPLGIVHRDVSPQNVMLSYDGQVKLLDFGIAKANGSDELTREGMIKGKIDYMAPEQLKGEAIDPRADIFALGVMLWEAITGARFSGGAEVAEITKMHNRVVGKEPRLRDVAPEAPMRLVEICEKAIALHATDRHATAEEFATSIADYLAETSRTSDARQLADILGECFAAEQKKMRTLVEEQLRLLSANDTSVDELAVPVIVSQEGHTMTPSAPDVAAHLDQLPSTNGDSTWQLAGRAAPRRFAAVAVVVASVFGGALAAVRTTRGGAVEEARRDSAEMRAPDPARAEATTIRLRIEASPPNAQAELDGRPLELPFERLVPRDGALHRLVVRAPEREPAERTLSYDRDALVHVDLAVLPGASQEAADATGDRPSHARASRGSRAVVLAAAASAPTPTPSAPTAAPTPTPPTAASATPASTGRRAPSIEADDPYANQ